MKSNTIAYRPEIDGLRALAVVPVILFHAGSTAFRSGFYGVDVFFVISGCLITSIILAGMESERGFSLAHFYERRARRILPPLVLTMVITGAIAPLILMPHQIEDVGESMMAAALFASNYYFYFEISYFNPFASQAPLLHTWSLAVEEQFYLIFPLALMLIHRTGFRRRYFFGLLILASFFAAMWTSVQNTELAFYSIHTRAWELGIGGAVGLAHRQGRFAMLAQSRAGELIGLASLFVLVCSLTILPIHWRHPGIVTLLPVLATAAIIATTREQTLVWKILSNRLLVQVGLISYGLYLYHNPLFSFADAWFADTSSSLPLIKLALIPLVYAIAVASFSLVERPILAGGGRHRGRIFATAGSAILTVALIGFVADRSDGFYSQFAHHYRRAGMPVPVYVAEERRRIGAVREQLLPMDAPFDCRSENCRKILLVGDSLSGDSFFALSSFGKDAQYRRVHLDDECMAGISRIEPVDMAIPCRGESVRFGRLLENADEIVLIALWQPRTYVSGYRFASMMTDVLNKPVTISGAALFPDLATYPTKAWQEGYRTRAQLAAAIFENRNRNYTLATQELENLVTADPSIGWVSREAFFCDRHTRRCEMFNDAGMPLIWDNAHMTVAAYADFAAYFETALAKNRRKTD